MAPQRLQTAAEKIGELLKYIQTLLSYFIWSTVLVPRHTNPNSWNTNSNGIQIV